MIAGTAWVEWDAWKGQAPDFERVPMAATHEQVVDAKQADIAKWYGEHPEITPPVVMQKDGTQVTVKDGKWVPDYKEAGDSSGKGWAKHAKANFENTRQQHDDRHHGMGVRTGIPHWLSVEGRCFFKVEEIRERRRAEWLKRRRGQQEQTE